MIYYWVGRTDYQNIWRLDYYGDSEKAAKMLYDAMKSGAALAGLKGEQIKMGTTTEKTDNPSIEDFQRWATETK
jgi:hypothetical protein